MAALDHAVRCGKALYAGLSNYGAERTREAAALLRRLGTPCLIHQARYNLFDREIEARPARHARRRRHRLHRLLAARARAA